MTHKFPMYIFEGETAEVYKQFMHYINNLEKSEIFKFADVGSKTIGVYSTYVLHLERTTIAFRSGTTDNSVSFEGTIAADDQTTLDTITHDLIKKVPKLKIEK